MLKKRRLMFIVLTLVVALLVAVGCGARQPDAPAATAPPQQTYTLQVATTWPSAIMLHQMPVKWAEEVAKASGGRLQIEIHPAGALVGAPEVLDATTAGTIDGYHTFSGYWIGKMPGAPFFSSVPMTLEPFMHLVWIYEGGGLDLWQKMYDEAGYNVKILPLGITHPEILAWSNRPLRKLEDWSGLKYRTVGWWAEILRANEVAVTTLPAAELYPALERGVLDALEFSTPYNDQVLAFNEVAKYLAGPGMHQPGTLFYVGINKASWDALPDDLKALVEASARSTTLWSWAKDFSESMNALDAFQEEGVTLVEMEDATQLKLKEDTWTLLDARATEQGGVFAETWQSIKDFRARFIDYENFMVPLRVE